jgi:hypothetical protein
VAAGFSTARFRKNMQEQFFFEADQQAQLTTTGKVNDTIAMYSSPLQRIRNFGAEAFTEIDALSLLLDAHDAVLAGELLTEFGSLTGLSRASVVLALKTERTASRLWAFASSRNPRVINVPKPRP